MRTSNQMEIQMFTKHFDSYACVGELIECTVGDTTYYATLKHDHDATLDDDMHNVDQSVTGCDAPQQARLLAAREAWHAGQWSYCGLVLSASRGIWSTDNICSVWGLEVNYPDNTNWYLLEAANELLSEAIEVLAKEGN